MQRPCLELVHTTLPALSAWAPAMGAKLFAYWAFALLSLPIAAVEFEDAEHGVVRRAFLMVLVGVYAVLPLLLLYAPAKVSSELIDLLSQINQLRIRSEFADKFSMWRMERAARLCKSFRSRPSQKSERKLLQTTTWSKPTGARDRASPWATRLSI